MTPPIVVGVDTAAHSAHAVSAAAGEARLRNAPLWLCHAYQLSDRADGEEAAESPRTAVARMLDEIREQVRADYPELLVERRLVLGPPGSALAEISAGAALLVVGSRHSDGVIERSPAPVVPHAIDLASCPVMVARGEPAGVPSRRITIGVDMTEPFSGTQALDFVFDEAILRRAEVFAVYAWDLFTPRYPGSVIGSVRNIHVRNTVLGKRLGDFLQPWRDKYPDVLVDGKVSAGPPSRLLIDSAGSSDLLVLGGRRRADRASRLGAMTHAMVHHARCPVVVVHH